MPMAVDLQPCTSAHAALVASWARSRNEAVMWCGEGEFPVPAERVVEWQREADVRGYLLVEADFPVGYGELWLDADESEVELARIIIAPAARGQQRGRQLVRQLLAEAAKTGWSDVFIRVHPDNDIALRCYQGVGFRPVDAALAQQWNALQPVEYLWLQHRPQS
jgi:ribosomal protein S18 acetylase RimI-like enzyme